MAMIAISGKNEATPVQKRFRTGAKLMDDLAQIESCTHYGDLHP